MYICFAVRSPEGGAPISAAIASAIPAEDGYTVISQPFTQSEADAEAEQTQVQEPDAPMDAALADNAEAVEEPSTKRAKTSSPNDTEGFLPVTLDKIKQLQGVVKTVQDNMLIQLVSDFKEYHDELSREVEKQENIFTKFITDSRFLPTPSAEWTQDGPPLVFLQWLHVFCHSSLASLF